MRVETGEPFHVGGGANETPSVFVSAIRAVSRIMRASNMGIAPVLQKGKRKGRRANAGASNMRDRQSF